jgi:hypothetical protein
MPNGKLAIQKFSQDPTGTVEAARLCAVPVFYIHPHVMMFRLILVPETTPV